MLTVDTQYTPDKQHQQMGKNSPKLLLNLLTVQIAMLNIGICKAIASVKGKIVQNLVQTCCKLLSITF